MASGGLSDNEVELRKDRPLTEGGEIMLDNKIKTYTNSLKEIQQEIDDIIKDEETNPLHEISDRTVRQLQARSVSTEIRHCLDIYTDTSNLFCNYLDTVRSQKADTEKRSALRMEDAISSAVSDFVARKLDPHIDIPEDVKPDLNIEKPLSDGVTVKPDLHAEKSLPEDTKPEIKHETDNKHVKNEEKSQSSVKKAKSGKSKSVKSKISAKLSKHSGISSSSSVNSVYMRQKAKLEEARVRLKFVKKEAELLKEQAELNAKLKVLDTERQFEEYEKGLNAMNEFLESDDNSSVTSDGSELSDTIRSRTKEFIENSTGGCDEKPLNPEAEPYEPENQSTQNTTGVKPKNQSTKNTVGVKPKNQSTEVCQEISNFIVKKDMLLKRIHEFDDRPEFFGSWKTTFQDVVNELNLKASEEVDLLIRYLGPESKKSAISIQSANYSDPCRAKERIWQRLHERFARPEMVESSIKQKLSSFDKVTNKDPKHLYELVDIVTEIDSLKRDDQYSSLFAFYDSSQGVNNIIAKLPYQLQEKWTNEASRYKEENSTAYPPFHVFASFLERMARRKNDPSFDYEDSTVSTKPRRGVGSQAVFVKKTEVPSTISPGSDSRGSLTLCPLHNTSHTLNKCYQFRQKPLKERHEFLRSKGLCFKCCGQKPHLAKDCRSSMKCGICKATTHATALHVYDDKGDQTLSKQAISVSQDSSHHVSTMCTAVCRGAGSSKSCAKTLLVKVYPKGKPEQAINLYAIIDEQSTHSLARSSFFDHFSISGPEEPYFLKSCSGDTMEYGRRCSDFVIESVDASCQMTLPTLIECDQIPDTREEIPSPEVAREHPHLRDIANFIPPVRNDAEIMLLIGRDLLPAHHVLEQWLGPNVHDPYAQKLRLGWVVIGNVCLGVTHQHDTVSVMKTFTLKDGRTTLLEPCHSNFKISENNIFTKTRDDDTPGLSVEDKQFLNLMDSQMYKGSDGCWTAPLPFRQDRQRLPNNRPQALRRARMLDANLRRNPEKMNHALDFMRRIIDNGHAEQAQELDSNTECWYLPLFAVYHPKKPGSIRCVFDSSAKFEGVSLNDVLLTGPDLVNSLLGILLRFRQYPIAVTADIEQMFYRFSVPEKHRDYLRFMWYRDNNPSHELIEYRMTRHVFGNSPSPAVATFGLRKCVATADEDVKKFVLNNFYVDDALLSVDSAEEAVNILSRTQTTLREQGNIRLHKVSSNSIDVIKHFSSEDLAKEVTGVELDLSQAPLQRSLGVSWDIYQDSFTFQVSREQKPLTKRGLLATINSLYDPIGFVSPVTIHGKFILQDVMSTTVDWDDPLSTELCSRWNNWKESLVNLESVAIPRCYTHPLSSQVARRELHVFSDASQRAIGAVAFLRIFDINGNNHVSFVHGKARVAPVHGHTIPRLELCAAVLATNLKETVLHHLSFPIDSTTMYSDSKVVLGYINNERRRFYVYVSNRVDIIRQSTTPDQWTYVSSEENPADIATRSISASDIGQSAWIQGPTFLRSADLSVSSDTVASYPLISPETDIEVRPVVVTTKTKCSTQAPVNLGVHHFEHFSDWNALIRGIARLKRSAKAISGSEENPKPFKSPLTSQDLKNAETFVLKQVQNVHFSKEVSALMEGRDIPRTSSILPLSPFLDQDGILRIGGRLKRCKMPDILDLHPVIIPRKSHIGQLLIRHYHQSVHHQGRHLTEGKVRAAGYWIVGCKREVTSFIHRCVICRKLRGRFGGQIMADLPEDRVTPSPPFTFVGVDTFGPWNIVSRRTRGGQANPKRWAILFTCLVCRAVHIEVVEELSSSSFINALRRFISIRGPVRQFRSDRGTNFIGAAQELGMDSVFVEDPQIQKFLNDNRATWVFNPPHASHFGGAWERMIGTTRRILDAMLLRTDSKGLTHEVLTTFMAEVCSIINSRPIAPVSTDPEDSCILTPNILLTQKMDVLPDDLPSFGIKDAYRAQWKHVVLLAQEFWKKWREQYLSGFQLKRKWTSVERDFEEGDVVLLRDNEVHRNQWPMAIVEMVFPSEDGHVRKVQIRVAKDRKCYVRPVCELIPLLHE